MVPTQIIWSFDTTGSMSSCLETVKTQIKQLSSELFKRLPELEIGIIAHGDYCDENSTYLIKHLPFSTDPSEIASWVAKVGPTGGGDAPEAYEIALHCAATEYRWKTDAHKVVVIIGDEVPHTKDYPGNTNHVDWNAELEHLANLGVRVFGVQCFSNGHAKPFYKALADQTDGLHLPMHDLAIIKDVFMAICLQVSDYSEFEKFSAQLRDSGPVASSLVPMMTKLAKKKKLSEAELAEICGVVSKLSSEHGKAPRDIKLPLQEVAVDACLSIDSSVSVTLVQTYVNELEQSSGTARTSEFQYRFPVPPQAAVYHFEAELLSSGKRIVGVVKGKETAQQEYRAALRRGEKAFLVQQQDADIFSMDLGNLEAGERIKITLSFITEVEEVGGSMLRLRLPQHVAPRCGASATMGSLAHYPVTVSLRVDGFHERQIPVKVIRCPGHERHFEASITDVGASGRLHLSPDMEITLNSDLVFDFVLNEDVSLPAVEAVAGKPNAQNPGALIRVAVRPGADHDQVTVPCTNSTAETNFCIIIDGSASMMNNWPTAVAAAKETLSELQKRFANGEAVHFDILIMRSSVEALFNSFKPAQSSAIEDALTFLSASHCGGGSDFGKAVEKAADMHRAGELPVAAILISDFLGPEHPVEVFAKVAVAAESNKLRLFALGVGRETGAELLQGMASVGFGSTEVGCCRSDVVQGAQRLVHDAVSLAYCSQNVSVEFLGLPNGIEMAPWPQPVSRVLLPRRRTDLYFQGALNVSDLPAVRVRVSGGFLKEPKEVPVVVLANGRTLSRICARSYISSLERRNTGGQHDAAILELALAEGMASSQTSFVAVEHKHSVEEPEQPEPQPCLAEQPDDECNSARGWDECSMRRSRRRTRMRGPTGYEGISTDSLECTSALAGAASPMMAQDLELDRLAEASRCLAATACVISENLEHQCAMRSDVNLACCDLMSTSLSFQRSACKRRLPGEGLVTSLASAGKVAASAARTISNRIGGMSRGLKSLRKGTTSKTWTPPKNLPTTAVLSLARGAARYQGTLTHHLFGPDPVNLTIAILREISPGEYEGEWAAMGQVELVSISLKDSSPHLIITNTSGKECTMLQGEVDPDSGALHGSVRQGKEDGGKFHLFPVMSCLHRVELTDTDDDLLVFLRSTCGEFLAEYCNGELVVANVISLHFDSQTKMFSDSTGSFRLPEDKFEEGWHMLSMIMKAVDRKVSMA
eukprot:gnl/MRDRNA2_/MRDRNA2_29937_c0_seq1.p1 gnl/MRDRNA2_/MRDRNA2_29937_c0~~gnl/MRDRNA2_/MRDRNA2_29937_c0_seq1.p1  ORF type:complete len:1218 (-),score=238.80 gnl/MRDRNA2_/MRDRNA2_29937_c0_seq1:45-3698(-)